MISNAKHIRFYLLNILLLLLLCLPVSAERLTLEQCIDIAKKNNLDIRSAEHEYNKSRQDVWSAYGGLMPRLDSWLGASRTITGPTDFLRYDENTQSFVSASTGISVSKNYSAGFQLSQTIFDGGANIYGVYGAKADNSGRRYGYEMTVKDIVYEVKEKYYSLDKARMLIEVRNDAVRRGQEQLKIAQSRYELGSASISDVLKAKVQVANDKLDLVEAENNYKLTMADLNYIMNRDVNLEIEPVQELSIRQIEYDYEDAVDAAMERHPGLLQAERNLEAARYNKLASRGSWFPRLTLSASYSWNEQSLDYFVDNFWDKNYRWNVSGSLNFNIFNGFQTKASYTKSRITYRSAQDNYFASQNAVALEVKQAFLNLQKANQKLLLTEESEKAAQEDFDLAQEKYNLGAATILDVIDAQVNYKLAEANRIQSLFDYNLAVSQLEKAMGF